MRTIDGRKFEHLNDDDLPATLADVVLSRCSFVSCAFGHRAAVPSKRRSIKNVVLRDCTAYGWSCIIGTAVIEDIEVENLRVGAGVFRLEGAVYKHVSIRGRCGEIRLAEISPLDIVEKGIARRIERFRPANAAFYESVDWALDISQAEFETGFSIDCHLPARLVRRDPKTQVVVRRENVEAMSTATWNHLDSKLGPYDAGLIAIRLTDMLRTGVEETVIAAPKRGRRVKDAMRQIQVLRDAGVAESD